MRATYQPLKNDGALFTCTECGEKKLFNQCWFVQTPNNWRGIICKDCIDEQWKTEFADFISDPI